MPGEPTEPHVPSRASRLWRRWGWLVRWLGALAGVLYVCTLIHFDSLKTAFASVPGGVLVAVFAVNATSQLAGAIRWRVALRAYGAITRPSLATAVRLYLVAVFYNTYLPGAVGGDVVRAVVTRDSFGEHGTTGALAVVFVERVLGLFSVFALMLTGVVLSGESAGIQGSIRFGAVIGGACAVAALFALPLGRKLAPYLPGPLSRIAARLPAIVRPIDFVFATALSLITQLLAVFTGWMILVALHPSATFADALLIVPAALATVFLPITVGGTGAREAVFVLLGGQLLGMSSDDAVAASLLLWMVSLVVGAIGGVLLLAQRRNAD